LATTTKSTAGDLVTDGCIGYTDCPHECRNDSLIWRLIRFL
jgi:hypothetical protein